MTLALSRLKEADKRFKQMYEGADIQFMRGGNERNFKVLGHHMQEHIVDQFKPSYIQNRIE